MRNQFLKEMDGLQDKSENFRVYVIGATNKPWRLDEPFLRRFQKRIYIPLPDERMRVTLLKAYTQKIPLDQSVDLVELAKRLDGYSASDLASGREKGFGYISGLNRLEGLAEL